MTAAVVVLVGVEEGIVLAMIVSLMRVVRHGYHPHSGVLEENPDGTWKLAPVAPHVVTEPGLVLYLFGAELFYANAGRFLEEVSRKVVQPMPSAVKWVVVDAEAMTHLDYTAARVVKRLKENLDKAGVELAFARVRVFHELVSDKKSQYLMLDSTIVRAHQQAATGRKKGARTRLWGVPEEV